MITYAIKQRPVNRCEHCGQIIKEDGASKILATYRREQRQWEKDRAAKEAERARARYDPSGKLDPKKDWAE